jgi:hypothetical protein
MNLKIHALLMAIFCLAISAVKAQQPPDFNAQKAAGIFQYDIDKVMKSLKISDDTTKQKISEALIAYNNEMFQLSTEHASTFQELEDEFDRNVQIAMQRRDRSQMDGVKAKIERIIPPIRMQVATEEKILNDAMAMILTEKQNEKWLKYQRRKKG